MSSIPNLNSKRTKKRSNLKLILIKDMDENIKESVLVKSSFSKEASLSNNSKGILSNKKSLERMNSQISTERKISYKNGSEYSAKNKTWLFNNPVSGTRFGTNREESDFHAPISVREKKQTPSKKKCREDMGIQSVRLTPNNWKLFSKSNYPDKSLRGREDFLKISLSKRSNSLFMEMGDQPIFNQSDFQEKIEGIASVKIQKNKDNGNEIMDTNLRNEWNGPRTCDPKIDLKKINTSEASKNKSGGEPSNYFFNEKYMYENKIIQKDNKIQIENPENIQIVNVLPGRLNQQSSILSEGPNSSSSSFLLNQNQKDLLKNFEVEKIKDNTSQNKFTFLQPHQSSPINEKINGSLNNCGILPNSISKGLKDFQRESNPTKEYTNRMLNTSKNLGNSNFLLNYQTLKNESPLKKQIKYSNDSLISLDPNSCFKQKRNNKSDNGQIINKCCSTKQKKPKTEKLKYKTSFGYGSKFKIYPVGSELQSKKAKSNFENKIAIEEEDYSNLVDNEKFFSKILKRLDLRVRIKPQNCFLTEKMSKVIKIIKGSLKNEFGNSLSFNFEQNLNSSSKSLKSQKSLNPSKNCDFGEWSSLSLSQYLNKIKKEDSYNLIRSFNGEKNYQLLLRNIFLKTSEVDSKWDLVHSVLRNELKSYIIKKLSKKKKKLEEKSQDQLELILTLFLLHLDIPKILIDTLSFYNKILVKIIIIFNTLDSKLILLSHKTHQTNFFNKFEEFFQREEQKTNINKETLSKVYYVFNIFIEFLKNFRKMKEMGQEEMTGTFVNNQVCKMINISKDFCLRQPKHLEELLEEINLNEVQQFFIFTKNFSQIMYENPKNKKLAKFFRVYFYSNEKHPSKIRSWNLKAKIIKQIEFRKIKRNSEVSKYIQRRLNKHLKKFKNLEKNSSFFFNEMVSISLMNYQKYLTNQTEVPEESPWSNNSILRIEKAISKSIKSSIDIPSYILAGFKCTNQFQKFGENILKKEIISHEINRVLNSDCLANLLGKKTEFGLLEKQFTKKRIQLPWSILELFAGIKFHRNIKPLLNYQKILS